MPSDLIVDSFDATSQKSSKRRNMTQSAQANTESQMLGSQVPDTITFNNTTTYGRILGTPSKENPDHDEPDLVKYVKGYGVSNELITYRA